MPDHFMPEDHCPICGYHFDCATNLNNDGPPEPEDLTLCLRCGTISQWDFAMHLHALTVQELKEMPTETLEFLARAQGMLFRTKAERN